MAVTLAKVKAKESSYLILAHYYTLVLSYSRCHFQHTNFISGSESVFDRSESAYVALAWIAFQVQDSVHQVLNHARPCHISLFCYMPDKEHRRLPS